ncbi:RsiV family protein [soil metagenome]
MRARLMVVVAAVSLGLGPAPAASAETPPQCADFGGAMVADQMCEVHVSDPQYLLDMSFPVNYPDEAALTAYLAQTRDGFVNVAEMPGNWNLPYALDVKSTRYTAGAPEAGTRSLALEVYQNVGGAHPSTWYQTFNYDVAKKSPVTFDTLFAAGSEPVDAIYPSVMRTLTQQLGQPSISPVGDGLDPAHYQNFVITDDAVIFFFGQGELLPEAAGALQASVPRSALPPLQV